ncbi:hypothetical protein ACJIZ3_013284 [Penstemon smallii]|uniref:O-fucosyltransferase family protein n=1 Tax=Penstemon smallii TaxID=265156 RepID=A0ABD3UPE6_9LAMI
MGKQGSPKSSRPGSLSFDASSNLEYQLRWEKAVLGKGIKNNIVKYGSYKGVCNGKRHTWWLHRHIRSIIFTFLLMGFLFLLDSLMFSLFNPSFLKTSPAPGKSHEQEGSNTAYNDEGKGPVMYSRLLQMASVSLAERELEQKESKYWKQPFQQASMWKPCADIKVQRDKNSRNGFILVSSNGGLNQQRVAVCNAVAVSSLLNATLVIPKFLYSNVWKDPSYNTASLSSLTSFCGCSQFSDIYQEETFMNILKDDIDIVKELPSHLKSMDFEAFGSLVTDADLSKEATPEEYIKNILPILLKNRVVHFLGFGNRLGFDPLPSDLQKLRCKCNFHALKYVLKIQKTASLLVKRIRKNEAAKSMLDKQLLGNFISNVPSNEHTSKYLALHLRFEVDMVAYSMCDFGGGENEIRELQAYREEHFPLLLERLKKTKYVLQILKLCIN